MYERIRELNMQAAEYATSVCLNHSRDWYPIQNIKFAELIVRECLEACIRANDIRYFVPPTQEQVVLSCMREIETTFSELNDETSTDKERGRGKGLFRSTR